jgi:uncharacterized protein (DUF885 family)
MKQILAAALLLLTACATSTHPTGSATLAKIADEYWQHQLEESPSLQVKFGLPTKHLPDPSFAHAQSEAKFAEEILRKLDGIDAKRLAEEDRLTHRLLHWYAQEPVEDVRFFWLRSPITPYASPLRGVNQLFTAKKLDTAERARLLGEYGHFIDQLREVIVEQQRRGILLPKPELPLVRGMIAGFIKPPESSALRGGDDSADVRDAITSVVNPSLQRLADVFNDAYESAAPAGVGPSQYPGGAEYYRALIRRETSLDLTPETIHEKGLQEVARISRELDDIRKEVGFNGTLAEFRQYLKTDPRFFAKSSDEIGERLGSYVRKIEPQIPRFFAKLPHAAYDVKRLDPSLEGAMTFGYYQVPTATDATGHYLYNGSKVNERNLLFAPALMLHELIPGHHFQINRQSENTSLPAFRRESFDTAFVEGWGEYSAWLGREMGIYDDPYDRAGRLMMDSLLSVRLVVDTGMNALGWPRDKAMQYMRENTFQSETEIATESLRYSADIPAQALAYKIGSLKMIELRREAEKVLGEKFDIRQFHEWILGSGSMPLAILEEHVRERMRAR